MNWEDEDIDWMRVRTSMILQRTLDLLSDGEWHPKDKIIQATMTVVPPGVALRYAQLKRYHMAKGTAKNALSPDDFQEWLAKNPTADTYEGVYKNSKDETQSLRVGARAKVLDQINKSKRIEQKVFDEVKMLRRIPLSEKARQRMGRKGGEAAQESE